MSPDDALRAVCLTAYATAAPYSFGTNPKRRRRDPRAAAALRTQVRLTACEAYLLAEDEEAEALLRLINAALRTINWSDRECVIDDDPEQIAAAVVACAVDHSYDRGQTGVPWGLSDEERELCKPIVAKHLGAIDPEWRRLMTA